ncbi:MAG: hypothetical protein KDB53_07180, partial [Planctomycetes bacterium]|nr:hypothetical protein [Planctomycetota bacterium]
MPRTRLALTIVCLAAFSTSCVDIAVLAFVGPESVLVGSGFDVVVIGAGSGSASSQVAAVIQMPVGVTVLGAVAGSAAGRMPAVQ